MKSDNRDEVVNISSEGKPPRHRLREYSRNIPWVVAFVLLYILLFNGLEKSLSFLPDSWGHYDAELEAFRKIESILAFYFSIILTAAILITVYWMRRKIRNLKTAIKIIRNQHKDLAESASDYLQNDIALMLIYSRFNILNNVSEAGDELRKVLEDYDGYSFLYWRMHRIDWIAQFILPAEIIQKYPRQIYDLREELLTQYIDARIHGESLIIKEEQETIKGRYFRTILDMFNERIEVNILTPEEFNMREFEKYLQNYYRTELV